MSKHLVAYRLLSSLLIIFVVLTILLRVIIIPRVRPNDPIQMRHKADERLNRPRELVLPVVGRKDGVGDLLADGEVAQLEQLDVAVVGEEALRLGLEGALRVGRGEGC